MVRLKATTVRLHLIRIIVSPLISAMNAQVLVVFFKMYNVCFDRMLSFICVDFVVRFSLNYFMPQQFNFKNILLLRGHILTIIQLFRERLLEKAQIKSARDTRDATRPKGLRVYTRILHIGLEKCTILYF